jgi:hypothetical protein
MITYSCWLGYNLPRGGQRITSQHLITASNYDAAVTKALRLINRGEQLIDLIPLESLTNDHRN